MTGYTVHTGTSKKFVAGFDRVFGGSTDSAVAKLKQSSERAEGSPGDSKKQSKAKSTKAGKSKK